MAVALEALVATPPRDYVRKTPAGQRTLAQLYQACRAAGLTAARAADDVACLHALFDVAVDHGLGHVVYDYVVEVCADAYLTSNDAVEAHLLDGECVREWCCAALRRASAAISQALSLGFGRMFAGSVVAREAGRLGALALVLRALAAPAEPAGTPPPGRVAEDGDLEEVTRLQQCVRVLEWLGRQRLALERPWGRPSEQEWRATVNKRRDAAAPLPLFLHDLLARLAPATQGGAALQYPPSSLERLVADTFLAGASDSAAWQAKLGLLLYTLLDVGHAVDLEAFRSGFDVAPPRVAQWRAAYLLDAAALEVAQAAQAGQDGLAAPSLDLACRILPGAATPDLPFRYIQALAACGAPAAALDVLRARGAASEAINGTGGAAAGGKQALSEAQQALGIRLECGLLTEGYLEARRHCEALGPAARAKHTRSLLRQLAEWAARAQALNSVLELPLSSEEEQVLVGWLEERVSAGAPDGDLLPLLYLQRGRLAEALLADAHIAPPPDGDALRADLAGQRRRLLTAAAQLLPRAQRALSVHAAADGAPALQLATQQGEGASGQDAQPMDSTAGDLLADGVSLAAAAGLPPDAGLPTLHVRPQGMHPPPLLLGDLTGEAPEALQQVAAEQATAAGTSTSGAGTTTQQQQQQQATVLPSLLLAGPAPAASSGAPSQGDARRGGWGAGLAADARASTPLPTQSAGVGGEGQAAPIAEEEWNRIIGLQANAGGAKGATARAARSKRARMSTRAQGLW